MKPLVVIPTYNEVDNIRGLVPEICLLHPGIHVLVVDDDSPDGTGVAVEELRQEYPGRLHLLRRERKAGLGRAYLAGFSWGLEREYDTFVQMDADFSHRPRDLERLLSTAVEGRYDFVVGSRLVQGGGTVNWGWGRRFVSRSGSLYARCILGSHLRDWTGGFNLWTRRTLEALDLEAVRSEGYSFQIELKHRASVSGSRGGEVPIIFEERRVGESKMSLRIAREALYRVWWLRLATTRNDGQAAGRRS